MIDQAVGRQLCQYSVKNSDSRFHYFPSFLHSVRELLEPK